MVGPVRPQFVLFGSSIVQFSFANEGWGAALSNLYARKADVFLRGYGGWTSRYALKVLDQVFPKNATVQPSLAIVYFGGNDSMEPSSPVSISPHVPLPEYIENMKKIALHLQSLSEKTRIIFLSVPPVNEKMAKEHYGETGRTNEGCRIYSEACLKLCQEMGIASVDLWNAIQQRSDWLTACFTDGIHLSAEGSKIVEEEIMKVIEKADWEPSLHWKAMPSEFLGISPFDSESS